MQDLQSRLIDIARKARLRLLDMHYRRPAVGPSPAHAPVANLEPIVKERGPAIMVLARAIERVAVRASDAAVAVSEDLARRVGGRPAILPNDVAGADTPDRSQSRGESETLAGRLERLRVDPSERERLAASGRRRAAAFVFDWEARAAGFVEQVPR